ncbi:hypothetical protein [Pelosinus sp. sgz500959]|uniref:hypothetical protein n=1 Tax=Pelosinus sp. sgz500959 TaxID=3242472 RepID=UPI00366ECDE4
MINFGKLDRGYIVIGILIVVVIIVVYFAWRKDAENETRVQETIVISQEDAKDKNVLQNKLDMSKQNAEMLASFVSQAQVGKVQPVAHRINGRDSALFLD